ncbi:DUF2897 family protein [Aliiglaciecola litoralis]|uniref:DUF2897 domain-containing protein n=1 Tax=Aliiglaciecola litoralis TaxID=582857 RepID=A0ABP3X2U0_9ALTE
MNTWLVLGLLLALGIIVGNIMLLKYSANMKFGKSSTKKDDALKSDSPKTDHDKP